MEIAMTADDHFRTEICFNKINKGFNESIFGGVVIDQ
jgi:hypothetical protein